MPRPQSFLYDIGAYEFSGSVADITAPIISAISFNTPGQTAVTITWTTDEPATSQINYGTTTAYNSTTTHNATLVTSHSVTITGLIANTLYNFRVRSSDGSANTSVSSNQTFNSFSGVFNGGGGGGSGSSKSRTPKIVSPIFLSTTTSSLPQVITPVLFSPARIHNALTSQLFLGFKGVEVERLQKMLASDPTIYPEAKITGFYGVLTKKAVERFQLKYSIVSGGTPEVTGFGQVGPKTLVKLNQIYGGVITNPSLTYTAPRSPEEQALIDHLVAMVAKLKEELTALQIKNNN